LASRSGKETLLERLIDSEILGPASNYQTASVIWAIRPSSALISAYRKAGLESERGRTGTSAKAQMDMASELQGWFTGKMKGLLKDLIGAMVGG
jgi:hypothetical protein